MKPFDNIDRRSVLKAIGAGVAGGVAFSGSTTATGGGLPRELATVRAATAAYNDPQNTTDAGYLPVREQAVCGMGYHWPNPGLTDLEVEKTEPELLVYGEDDDGTFVLGAVEYAVPRFGEYADDPPDLFDHADPEWHVLPVGEDAEVPFDGLWTLHVWVHSHNPLGVFHQTNPRGLFHPDGCGTAEH